MSDHPLLYGNVMGVDRPDRTYETDLTSTTESDEPSIPLELGKQLLIDSVVGFIHVYVYVYIYIQCRYIWVNKHNRSCKQHALR